MSDQLTVSSSHAEVLLYYNDAVSQSVVINEQRDSHTLRLLTLGGVYSTPETVTLTINDGFCEAEPIPMTLAGDLTWYSIERFEPSRLVFNATNNLTIRGAVLGGVGSVVLEQQRIAHSDYAVSNTSVAITLNATIGSSLVAQNYINTQLLTSSGQVTQPLRH